MNQNTEEYPDVLMNGSYFPSPVYWIDKPDVLSDLLEASEEHLNNKKRSNDFLIDKIYPVVMSDQLHSDERFSNLIQYIAQTSWNILDGQGYVMDNLMTTVRDAWIQEHQTYSGHEEHVHSLGCQMSAFYILQVPEKGSNLFISDPRPGKRQIDLIAKDEQILKMSDSKIHFNLKPGTVYFMNSWLPHGFTKNASDTSFKFIHFNIGVAFIPPQIDHNCNAHPVEII